MAGKPDAGRLFQGRLFVAFYDEATDELVLEADNREDLSRQTGLPVESCGSMLSRLTPWSKIHHQTALINGRRCVAHFYGASTSEHYCSRKGTNQNETR